MQQAKIYGISGLDLSKQMVNLADWAGHKLRLSHTLSG
jgi:hypothetical protein